MGGLLHAADAAVSMVISAAKINLFMKKTLLSLSRFLKGILTQFSGSRIVDLYKGNAQKLLL